jgi:hypothetical protein
VCDKSIVTELVEKEHRDSARQTEIVLQNVLREGIGHVGARVCACVCMCSGVNIRLSWLRATLNTHDHALTNAHWHKPRLCS